MCETGLSKIVVGGGCFWCTEAAYLLQPGVTAVVSGYANGVVPNPSYEAVCTGHTGHAEVIEVTFDPQVTTLDVLLDFFWQIHDPTTLNRQGGDAGTQYRSGIYFTSEAQRVVAEASRERATAIYGDRIVTEIVALDRFYPAEAYHQNYYARNPHAGYCAMVIKPKIDKAKKQLAARTGA